MQVLSSLSGIPFYAPSAGFAPTNSADVSAIASAYSESAASSKLDSTASSSFYPSDNPSGFISGVDLSDYATTAYVDSSVSGKLDTTAQVVTSIGVAAGALSSINGYGLSAGLANSAGTATVWLGASSKLDASAASDFALTAQLEDYLEKTASSQFLTAVPDGYATTEYVDSSISGFAYESAVSGWTAKQDALTFGYDADKISAINGSALAGGGGLVTAIGTSESGITSLNNTGIIDTAALHSSDYSSLYVQEPLYISASGESSYIGISGDVGGVDSATCSAIASAYVESGVSSKLDTTAQVVTAVGTETAITPDGVGDVVTSINGNYISALSADSAWVAEYDDRGRLLTSLASEYDISSIASSYAESAVSAVSGDYYSTSNPSGFITSAPFDSATCSAIASSYAESAVSSVSGDYYSTSNPSGFITGVDLSTYATTAYVDSSVSSKLDGSAIQYVAGSADATANGVLYILTGNT